MKRHFLSLLLGLFAIAANALTLEPVAGTSPQSTREGAFFGNDVAVIVRDDAGVPMAGVPVTFTVPTWTEAASAAYFFMVPSSSTQATAISDDDGIASVPWLLALYAGPIALTASAPDAQPVLFDLAVTKGMPWGMRIIAGGGQATPVDTIFPVRWTVQVLDEFGAPVPYAAVEFESYAPDAPNGTFEPTPGYLIFGDWPRALAKADAYGIAVAPPFRANGISGHGFSVALAEWGNIDRQGYVVNAHFQFTITPRESAH